MAMVVVPVVLPGWKMVVADEVPPAKATLVVLSVPALVFELVIGTLNETFGSSAPEPA